MLSPAWQDIASEVMALTVQKQVLSSRFRPHRFGKLSLFSTNSVPSLISQGRDPHMRYGVRLSRAVGQFPIFWRVIFANLVLMGVV